MKVDLYERIWMYAVGVILVLFFGSTVLGATRKQMHPPSHVETINPATALSDERFKERGVRADADGKLHVRVAGIAFAWLPAELVVPVGAPVTFHLTSADVTHGYQIVGTNGQAMVIPGYISQFTTVFAKPGEYLIVCNEYCGIGHHTMQGKLRVVPADQWQPAPTASAVPATGSEASHVH